MQIISELERYRRGPYAGAVGYRFPDGSLDTCIAIRTIVLADGVAHLQAGAGIVADSTPTGRARRVPAQARRARDGPQPRGGERPMTLLLVDNYDSFTYNLAHLLEELGGRGRRAPERRDRRADAAEQLEPTHLVVSPGPGRPGGLGRRRST